VSSSNRNYYTNNSHPTVTNDPKAMFGNQQGLERKGVGVQGPRNLCIKRVAIEIKKILTPLKRLTVKTSISKIDKRASMVKKIVFYLGQHD
jgi:hypothetical protein